LIILPNPEKWFFLSPSGFLNPTGSGERRSKICHSEQLATREVTVLSFFEPFRQFFLISPESPLNSKRRGQEYLKRHSYLNIFYFITIFAA